MATRQTHEDIELSGRRWRIKKFDAMTGSCVATKLIGKLGGILAAVSGGKVNNPAAIAMAVSEALSSMSRTEFMEMQTDALSMVSELVSVAGVETPQPVRFANGTWAVKDLSDDLVTVMALVTHSLIFNLSPFFDSEALTQALSSFKALSLFSQLESTVSAGDQ